MIPLPAGEWTVSGVRRTTSEGFYSGQASAPILRMVLVNPKANPSAIYIRTTIGAGSGFGWSLHSWCRRRDMLHRTTRINIEGGDQECWWINHIRMSRSSRTPPEFDQAFDYARRNKIQIPINAIQVGYRLADNDGFLTLQYFFNPEAEGFAPPRRAAWSTSDWHRDRIGNDPKKVAYIDQVKDWGRAWLPKVKVGFDGKLASGTSMQPGK